MKLKWISADKLDRNIKATAHKSGKLGFTLEAAKKLKLENQSSVKIAINEEDETDKNLYVAFYETEQEGAFRISKAGHYYYINTKPLFDDMKIDYINDTVVYDIVKESTEDSLVIYAFKRRANKKAPAKTGAS